VDSGEPQGGEVLKERACRNCRLVTDGSACSGCGSTNLSSDWAGYVIIRNPESSKLAERLNITKPGKYALKVR
jgi:DNA-directed RNA polymerase subunit E"